MAPLSNMPPTSDEPPDWNFGDAAHQVYPTGPSGRLARSLDVNQRLVQRWISGEQEPTNRAIEYLKAQQQAVLKTSPAAELERMVESWSAAGMDNEAIGAHLAEIYERLLERQIT
jgi:uncharacterized protein YgbK (DUF1537 family)